MPIEKCACFLVRVKRVNFHLCGRREYSVQVQIDFHFSFIFRVALYCHLRMS